MAAHEKVLRHGAQGLPGKQLRRRHGGGGYGKLDAAQRPDAGGREGGRKEGRREGEKKGAREGGREGGRKAGREGGGEGGKQGGREREIEMER